MKKQDCHNCQNRDDQVQDKSFISYVRLIPGRIWNNRYPSGITEENQSILSLTSAAISTTFPVGTVDIAIPMAGSPSIRIILLTGVLYPSLIAAISSKRKCSPVRETIVRLAISSKRVEVAGRLDTYPVLFRFNSSGIDHFILGVESTYDICCRDSLCDIIEGLTDISIVGTGTPYISTFATSFTFSRSFFINLACSSSCLYVYPFPVNP